MPEQEVKDNLAFIIFNGLDFATNFLEISLSSLHRTILKIKLERMGYFVINFSFFIATVEFKKNILA